MQTPLDQARAAEIASRLEDVINEAAKVIVGQRAMIEGMVLGLLTDGHILLEGVPGLAKTLAVHTLANIVDTGFQRIQFTPDLLPADLIGTTIYEHETGSFSVKRGPIFSNIILADEINRAPAKVQSALLEVMQERQVTIGGETFAMAEPFMVFATQNPIEQEGTYPLPEAQVDRFMMKLRIDYPDAAGELMIMDRMAGRQIMPVRKILAVQELGAMKEAVNTVHLDEKIKTAIVDIVLATRNPAVVSNDLERFVAYGASPRATIGLAQAARARALTQGRIYVNESDLKIVAYDVLRHRILMSYEADAEQKTSEDVIHGILEHVFKD